MVFAGFMIPNFFGGVLAAKFSAHRTQQVSTFAYLIVSVLLVYGVAYHQFLAFVFGGMEAGFFAGAMFNGAMRACLSRIPPAQRAVVFALIFLISYAGAGLPNLGIAFFAPNAELVNLLQGYLVLISVVALVVLWKLPRKAR